MLRCVLILLPIKTGECHLVGRPGLVCLMTELFENLINGWIGVDRVTSLYSLKPCLLLPATEPVRGHGGAAAQTAAPPPPPTGSQSSPPVLPAPGVSALHASALNTAPGPVPSPRVDPESAPTVLPSPALPPGKWPR